MKRFALLSIGFALVAACITGCSWETGSDAESWSSSYNWVNFSGVYRGSTSTDLDPDYKPGETNYYDEIEGPWILQTSLTQANGKVAHGDIVPGSVTVSIEGQNSLTDFANKNGTLIGENGAVGHISYDTGVWSFTLLFAPDSPRDIMVSYNWEKISEESGTEFGSTTTDAYSFTVLHNGEHLTITDNIGLSYAGQIGQMRSSSGAQNTDIIQVSGDESKYTYYESPLPENGDQIVASFECSGSGGKIVGTLEGIVNEGIFNNRRMDGTLISASGTDDITALAPAVTVETPAPAPVAAPTDSAPTDATEAAVPTDSI